MSLTRRISKLRKFSSDELRARLADRITCFRERRQYRRGANGSGRNRLSEASADGLLAFARSLVPGASRDQLSDLASESPDLFDRLNTRVTARAGRALSGSYEMLGQPFDLRSDVDWHRDPRSGFHWPRAFYADVTLNPTDERVDVKLVWELGRQQYLFELAGAWLITEHEPFAENVRRLLLGWISHNPPYEGIHWTSALEVAMRSISWIWALGGLAGWEGWHPGDLEGVADALHQHAGYLEHHLSFYASPYNHLMGEATALVLLGRALASHPDADRWQRVGTDVLAEHGPRQFYGDGFTVEQATGYHFFTLGFLLQALLAVRGENTDLHEIEQTVHRAFQAALQFRKPDGRWPAIGDLDSARSVPVLADDAWDFDGLCAVAAVMFHDPQLKPADARMGEELYWLLGTAGLRRWKELNPSQPPRATVLPDAGYAIARTDEDWLLFDAGPVAAGLFPDATPSTAHGHADTLQLLYTAGRNDVLIDSGIASYRGPGGWVEHFRSPAAHNTLEVEGAGPVRSAGPLDWSHAQPPPGLDANLSDDIWLARARVGWGAAVVIERYVLGIPGRGLWVADRIESDTPRSIRWYWQLPETGVSLLNGDTPHAGRQALPTGGWMLAMWSDAPAARYEIETACPESPVGWQGRAYGRLQRGCRVIRELPPVRRVLTAAYIGTQPAAFQVTVRGDRLNCRFDRDPHPHTPAGRAPAEKTLTADVVWTIDSQDGPLTFAAGVTTVGDDSRTTPLSGIGDWTAVRVETFREAHDISSHVDRV